MRVLQICFLCLICFTLGRYYATFYGKSDCITSRMDPDHAIYPELKDSFLGQLKSQSAFLAILIITHPNHVERRTAIRQTWLNVDNRNLRKEILPLFVVGSENLSEEVSNKIIEERNTHKDILVLPIQESYSTLTQKVLSSFVQVERNVKFSFLLKVDDDSFVNLPAVLDELKNSNYNKGLYWGFFDGRAPVQKTGKWAEKDYVLCDR